MKTSIDTSIKRACVIFLPMLMASCGSLAPQFQEKPGRSPVRCHGNWNAMVSLNIVSVDGVRTAPEQNPAESMLLYFAFDPPSAAFRHSPDQVWLDPGVHKLRVGFMQEAVYMFMKTYQIRFTEHTISVRRGKSYDVRAYPEKNIGWHTYVSEAK